MLKSLLIAGLVLIGISGIMLGEGVSGDQQRGNYYSEATGIEG
jgi:hypothetical protein